MSLFGSIFGFINTGRAAKSVSDANIAAEHGVLDANTNGREDILRSLGQGRQGTESAFNTATGNVNDALGTANTNVNAAGQKINDAATSANGTLQDAYDTIRSDNAAGRASGDLGNQKLQDYVNGDNKFKFSYDDYKNDPAYQFELEQGTNAIQNSAAAHGLSQGGAVLADLTKYGQGVAATHYNDAFARAQKQFQTNQDATLANLHELINSGGTANTLTANAGLDTSGKISANTTAAAKDNASLQEFLGTLNTSAQEDLGSLGVGAQLGLAGNDLSGAKSMAELGLDSATRAGNFATGAGNAHAAGIIGQGAAVTQGVSDLAGLFKTFVPGLGAGKTGAAMGGLFG
jgi:hypothetical protein